MSDLDRLLRLLDIRTDAPDGLAAEGLAPPFGPEAVEELIRRFDDDPDALLADAPAHLGRNPTADDVRELLERARHGLANPAVTIAEIESAWGADDRIEFPPEDRFPGYDPAIPIQRDLHRFEPLRDAIAWGTTAAAAWWFKQKHPKPPFRSHEDHDDDFVYDLRADPDGTERAALFSDWGTGYYHSRYIARHIADWNPGQALHLGDVYYTGGADEFAERFDPIVEAELADRMSVYALNANHEMDRRGLAYFASMDARHARDPARHPQRGSYFCLRGRNLQLVAIDTAYEENGRHLYSPSDGFPDVNAWLAERLREGRDRGLVNVLLSQSEPYQRESTELLEDLRHVLDDRLVDLWLWGDQHYAALYDSTAAVPFHGACIGHGGFPYKHVERCEIEPDFTRVEWFEDERRFPESMKDDVGSLWSRGNNGFATLTADADSVHLRFVDWRRRTRAHYRFTYSDGGVTGRYRVE